MELLNVEIKAKCKDASGIRNFLISNNADFRGKDEQTDTYFNVLNGRLKLREGNIENNLIYYERNNQTGPKDSHFQLAEINNAYSLKEMLSKSIGIKIVVSKSREIYFIKNVKFHLDEVEGLGSFVEIEAGNKTALDLSREQLLEQCNFYIKEFKINQEDLIDVSYSDLLLKKIKPI